MRRFIVRLSYIVLPIIAICAFLFVQQQMDGLAPAPPAAIPSQNGLDTKPVTPLPPQPTILAPEDSVSLPTEPIKNWPSVPVRNSSHAIEGSDTIRRHHVETAEAQANELLADPSRY